MRQFLQESDFRDLTVGEVMRRRRSAYYQYFADLHDLIISLLRDVETVMQQTVNPWIEDEGKRITALREIGRAHV